VYVPPARRRQVEFTDLTGEIARYDVDFGGFRREIADKRP
jgi:hypothetical protein